MRSTNAALALVGIVIIAGVMAWRSDTLPAVMFDSPAAPRESALTIGYALFVFALTVVGIFLGQFYLTLSPDRPALPVLQELRSMLSSREFARSVVASPIVFGVVYGMALRNPDPVMTIILALQNGFFCHSVVNHRRRDQDATGGIGPSTAQKARRPASKDGIRP